MRRRIALVAVLVGIMTVLPGFATATPGDESGNHKVTICHVTNSPTNPYVIITVDVAAFDGHDKSDHMHHVSKDGRRDVVATNGQCPAPDDGGDEPVIG
jgi:ABC-type sugar transport system substrate-binding protein